MTFWPEKFFADTAHIPGEAAAMYLVLLGHAWVRGGSLPDDRDQLRLMARCHPKRWGNVWKHISPFWSLGEDGRLHQKRLDEEWTKATTRRDLKVQNGISQIPKWISTKGKKAKGNKAAQDYSARARDPTPTPTEKNSALQAESSSLAPASLCVRAHASPALRVITNTEQPIPPDEQARVAEGLARLRDELKRSAAALDAS